MAKPTSRRNFILTTLAMAGSIACSNVYQEQTEQQASAEIDRSGAEGLMPERILGKTGISVPLLGLGGAGKTPLSSPGKEAEVNAILETAITLGIRYFDTAASYGPSEDYLGKFLSPYRAQILLASKSAARDRDGAWRELERSLERLKTDYLDFWQLHHVSFDGELDRIFDKNGAIQAIEEAKEQKVIRFSGITGHHDPDVISAALNRYPFDTTLVSVNAADVHHPHPFIPNVLPVAQEKNVGAIAMKVPAYGRLFKPGLLKGMHQAMGYVLSLPGVHSCVIAAENSEQLESNIRVARDFHVLDRAEMKNIENLTAQAWEDNTFFRKWS